MMKIRLLVLYVLVSAGVFAQNTGKLKKYLKENTLGNVADQRFADKKLTAKGAIEAEQVLLSGVRRTSGRWKEFVYFYAWRGECTGSIEHAAMEESDSFV